MTAEPTTTKQLIETVREKAVAKAVEYVEQLARIGDIQRLRNTFEHYRHTCENLLDQLVVNYNDDMLSYIQSALDIANDKYYMGDYDDEFPDGFYIDLCSEHLLPACVNRIKREHDLSYVTKRVDFQIQLIYRNIKSVSQLLGSIGLDARSTVIGLDGNAVISRDIVNSCYVPTKERVLESVFLYAGFYDRYDLPADHKRPACTMRQSLNRLKSLDNAQSKYIGKLIDAIKLFSGMEQVFYCMFVVEECIKYMSILTHSKQCWSIIDKILEFRKDSRFTKHAEWKSFEDVLPDLVQLYHDTHHEDFSEWFAELDESMKKEFSTLFIAPNSEQETITKKLSEITF